MQPSRSIWFVKICVQHIFQAQCMHACTIRSISLAKSCVNFHLYCYKSKCQDQCGWSKPVSLSTFIARHAHVHVKISAAFPIVAFQIYWTHARVHVKINAICQISVNFEIYCDTRKHRNQYGLSSFGLHSIYFGRYARQHVKINSSVKVSASVQICCYIWTRTRQSLYRFPRLL